MSDPTIFRELTVGGGIAALWLIREIVPIMINRARGNGKKSNGSLPGLGAICQENRAKLTEHETKLVYIARDIELAAKSRERLRREMNQNFKLINKKLDQISNHK